MNIIVLSRRMAKQFECASRWAAISIATFPEEFIELDEVNRVALLQMSFADALSQKSLDCGYFDTLSKIRDRKPELFTQDDAKKILDFVEQHKDDIDVLVVHCEAGLSRSPAVAAALHKIYVDEDDTPYFQKYFPNYYIYQSILHTKGLSSNKEGYEELWNEEN